MTKSGALAKTNGTDELVTLPMEGGDEGAQTFALMKLALDKGGDAVNQLEKLVGMYERSADRKARKDFIQALAEFQRDCPPIQKSSTAKITTSGGSGYSYTYADFEEIVSTVRPHLAEHGFSFTFDSSTDGKALTCTCRLIHSGGHEERTSFTLPTESKSAMSDQQKVGSALTFAKRQTLTAVLGLSLTDTPAPEVTRASESGGVTDDERATLEADMASLGVEHDKFVSYLGIESLDELTRATLKKAQNALNLRRKSGGGK